MACNPCTCILWFLVFLFIAWPVSFFCYFIFSFVGPLAGCIKCLEPVADTLIEGVKWPQTCVKNMCH
ncbi:Phospholipid:diacylglycerol acyltransferase 1 [Frankliniella fusca]|uniref:Phospholipid:diacylglycerol acyltransferase 1 n=1 Tax=Frankliniella fusca TaxID=407009 RepID=A0AAE1GWA1_9NEOP|nr:Phospholipid:diacylglycerol acyltransferase 1 [Frankliniella fusca]